MLFYSIGHYMKASQLFLLIVAYSQLEFVRIQKRICWIALAKLIADGFAGAQVLVLLLTAFVSPYMHKGKICSY